MCGHGLIDVDNCNKYFFSLTGKTLLELVIEQFEDLLVRILLLAACISFVSIKKNSICPYKLKVFY